MMDLCKIKSRIVLAQQILASAGKTTSFCSVPIQYYHLNSHLNKCKAQCMVDLLSCICSVTLNIPFYSHILKVRCKPLMLVECLSILVSRNSRPTAIQNYQEMAMSADIQGLSMLMLGIRPGLSDEEARPGNLQKKHFINVFLLFTFHK